MTAPLPVAALYVVTNGVYYGLHNVEPWDEVADARTYPGPLPVVAHPPCQRWGRYWSGGPSARIRRKKGDDNGCFAAALDAVRRWGGVLEHPEASHAWAWFGINKPPRGGGWVAAGDGVGWTCCVEQGNYGHAARKATWLYAVGTDLPELKWGSSGARQRLGCGYHSAAERLAATAGGKRAACWRILTKQENLATPVPFRNLLLRLARSVVR